jgi:hypothetical protein
MSAQTSLFKPKTGLDLSALLLDLSLSEDLGFNTAADGQVSFYALEGAQSWPYEWTPKRDEVFEEFDIEQFLSLTAQGGQEIEATENGQTLVITLGT